MSRSNSTTTIKSYHHLNEFERGKIEALHREKYSIRRIAKILERDPSTISREIKKHTVEQIDSLYRPFKRYFADSAQYFYRKARKNCGCTCKRVLANVFISAAENLIRKNKWSPDAAVGHLLRCGIKYEAIVCTKSLYNYINKGLLSVKPFNLLLKMRRRRPHRKYTLRNARNRNQERSIDLRPDFVNDRSRFGHWELDTVIGKKKRSAAIVSLVERVSRALIIRKIPDKSTKSVVDVIDRLENEFKADYPIVFQSITSDNGVEFADAEAIESSRLSSYLRTKLFYAHPFCSNERGSNENCNGIIRRFIPKGTNIDNISEETISKIQDLINSMPRKILNYQSANDVFNSQLALI